MGLDLSLGGLCTLTTRKGDIDMRRHTRLLSTMVGLAGLLLVVGQTLAQQTSYEVWAVDQNGNTLSVSYTHLTLPTILRV